MSVSVGRIGGPIIRPLPQSFRSFRPEGKPEEQYQDGLLARTQIAGTLGAETKHPLAQTRASIMVAPFAPPAQRAVAVVSSGGGGMALAMPLSSGQRRELATALQDFVSRALLDPDTAARYDRLIKALLSPSRQP